jgi:hypothetical protein
MKNWIIPTYSCILSFHVDQIREFMLGPFRSNWIATVDLSLNLRDFPNAVTKLTELTPNGSINEIICWNEAPELIKWLNYHISILYHKEENYGVHSVLPQMPLLSLEDELLAEPMDSGSWDSESSSGELRIIWPQARTEETKQIIVRLINTISPNRCDHSCRCGIPRDVVDCHWLTTLSSLPTVLRQSSSWGCQQWMLNEG